MSDNFTGGGDRYTEVTTTGWLGNIGNSFVGALFGLLAVVGSVILLYWNEGRAVVAYQALNQAAGELVEVSSDSVSPTGDGKLVHLTGTLASHAGARDPMFKVGDTKAVRLRRDVEMYQWKESESDETHHNLGGSTTTEKTYTYTREWADHPIDSSHFHVPNGHQNPGMSVRTATHDGTGVTLGAYKVDPGMLDKVDDFTPLSLPDDVTLPNGYVKQGDKLLRARAEDQPTVGDLQIGFSQVGSQIYSMIAADSGGSLTPYAGRDGYPIALATAGTASAGEMFKAKKAEEGLLTWILRGVGFVLMLIGFMLVARPLAVMVSVLPFLEGIADAGIFLVALVMAVPLTLVIIAIAWIAHRPVLGVALIVAAVVAVVGLRRLRGSRRVAAA